MSVAGLAVATNHDFFGAALANSAADFTRFSPDELGIMAHILDTSSSAVGRKYTTPEICFFSDPEVNHILGLIMA